MNYSSSTAAKNHGDEWGLTWYFLWEIYTSVSTWTHSQDSLAAAEAPILKISFHETFQIITKTIPISTRIVISYAMKQASRCEFDGESMETETTTWSEFPNEGKAIVEQILASEEINKSKRAGLWESQSGIRVGKLTIWVRSFEIYLRLFEKIIIEITRRWVPSE